jgi:two-component system, OmpR family, sensor histidine kinase KdpD
VPVWIEYRQMFNDSRPRPTPDELLAAIELEERRRQRGKLKIFLGYAKGVGKSFQILDEGRRRQDRGEDVVVCALQPEYPPNVQAILNQMEIIPTVKVGNVEVIDLAAVIHRHPQVVLIDGLAYENPPGSLNEHRWQDVEQLLDAGISVITTVNIQYLENLQDEVERITGSCAACIIPRAFLEKSADEIAVVDAPSSEAFWADIPEHSSILAEKHKLSRLRELALLVAAAVVDRQLEGYLRTHGAEQAWGVLERILVCITSTADAAQMLESGRRNADRFQGEFFAVYVQEPVLSDKARTCLEQNLDYARKLGARVETLTETDVAEAILTFAMQRGITQIFVGHSSVSHSIWGRIRGGLVARLIRSAEGIDVVVYPH